MKYLLNLLLIMLVLLIPSCQSNSTPLQPLPNDASFQVKTSNISTQQTAFQIKNIRGINYYPQNHPWQKLWLDYPKAAITQDLDRIHQLGFNTVRIFVFYDLFGGENIDQSMKNKLVDFLDNAQQHDLKVIVTLFDQYHDYASPNYAKAYQHIESLSTGLESHPAIMAWDLKNESDLDYPHYGKETVQNWLVLMQKKLRSRVSQPITASYARAQAMGSETQNLDYLTFHYYEREEDFSETVAWLRTRFPEKKLVLGEFGYHTWQNRPGDAHPEAHQFNYYNAILAQAIKTKLSGFLVWTLYDFSLSIQDVSFLEHESYNHHMGIISIHGNEKPAVKALRQAMHIIDASGHSITPLSKDFEVVFHLKEETNLKISLNKSSEEKLLWSGVLAAGAHTLKLNINEDQKNELLSLQSSLQSESKAAQGSSTITTLRLRQDEQLAG